MDPIDFQASSSEWQRCTFFTQTGNFLAAAAPSRYTTRMQAPSICLPTLRQVRTPLPIHPSDTTPGKPVSYNQKLGVAGAL